MARPVTTTCSEPRPKTTRRSDHNFSGRISNPMTNSKSTTPSSLTWRNSVTLCVIANPDGPTMKPVASKPRIDPRPT